MKWGNYYILCTVTKKLVKLVKLLKAIYNQLISTIWKWKQSFNLKNPNKNIALGNLSINYTWKNIKSAYNNNKVKLSPPTWNDTFDLSNGSYSIADIQQKHETLTENPPVQIYPGKTKSRIVFKIRTRYTLELLLIKLLGSTKKMLIKIKIEKMHQN